MNAARHALITGSASGLGAGIAVRLAKNGYRLTLTHRPATDSASVTTSPQATLNAVRVYDAQAQSLAVDFSTRNSTEMLLAELAQTRPPVDILVHAAGPMEWAAFARSSLSAYDNLLEANLGSAVVLSMALLPHMRVQQFGRLLFFGMTGSSVTQPARHMSLYGAAKSGLVSFARTLAVEEAQFGISVNCIEPGDIRDKQLLRRAAQKTPAKNPTGHAGSWEDIADAALFFTAETAAFTTGAVLAVGGGLMSASD